MQRDGYASVEAHEIKITECAQEPCFGAVLLADGRVGERDIVDTIEHHVRRCDEDVMVEPTVGYDIIIKQAGGIELRTIGVLVLLLLSYLEHIIRAHFRHNEPVLGERFECAVHAGECAVDIAGRLIERTGAKRRLRRGIKEVLAGGKHDRYRA